MKKLLMVTPLYPFPQKCGLSLRIYDLCKNIKDIFELHLFVLTSEEKVPNTKEDQSLFKNITLAENECSSFNEKTNLLKWMKRKISPPHFDDECYFPDHLLDKLASVHKHEKFDACIIVTPMLGRALKAFPSSVFKIIDTIDIFYQRYMEFSKIGQGAILNHFRDLDKEINLYKSADLVIAISLWDLDFLKSHGIRPIYVPISFVPKSLPCKTPQGYDILYPAGRGATNIDAIKYFIKDIFPLVKKSKPQTRFIIINPDNDIKNTYRERNDIICLPYLDKIEEAYVLADLTVIPLRAGSGIKIKVLESFSFGKPTLISRTAAQGIYLEGYPQKRISSCPSEMAMEILDTLDNHEYRNALVKKGLEIIQNEYNSKRVYAALREKLSQI